MKNVFFVLLFFCLLSDVSAQSIQLVNGHYESVVLKTNNTLASQDSVLTDALSRFRNTQATLGSKATVFQNTTLAASTAVAPETFSSLFSESNSKGAALNSCTNCSSTLYVNEVGTAFTNESTDQDALKQFAIQYLEEHQLSSSNAMTLSGQNNSELTLVNGDKINCIFNAASLKTGELATERGIVSPIKNVYNYADLSSFNGTGLESINLEEQHDVNSVTYFGRDYTQWAKLTSGSANEMTSLTLFTNSNKSSGNNNGGFVIDQGSGNNFKLYTDSTGGHIGWSNSEGTIISLNAGRLYTNAEIIDSSSFITYKNLIVNSANSNTISIPRDVQGYFGTKSNTMSGILIENQSTGSNAFSAAVFKQQDVTNVIGTYSSSSSSSFIPAGTFVMESQNRSGILINTSFDESGYSGSIRFGLGSNEIARFDISNTFLIGTTAPIQSSIFTVESKNKGVVLPKMHAWQREAITNPTEALIVYDLDLHKYCFFNGDQWEVFLSQIIN